MSEIIQSARRVDLRRIWAVSGLVLRRVVRLSLTTAFFGGCSAVTPWPGAQVQYYCQPGFDLGSDNRCWPRSGMSDDPPATALPDDPPPAAPAQHGTWDNWGRDAAMTAGVVGGIEAGTAADGAVAADAEAATVARAVPRLAPPLAAAGERAGPAAAVEGGAEADGVIIMIEQAGIWVMEHPWVLLESYKGNSPEPWRALVRQPVYTSRTEQKS